MKYRPKIGVGDFDTKTRKVSEFLAEGHKVKVTIMFRGREVFHPELGKKILDQVAERVAEVGKVEAAPRLDGRNMTMVLAPDKRAQQAKRAPKDATAKDPAASRASSSEAPAPSQPAASPAPAPQPDAVAVDNETASTS
jgi:translation initiation factor IF-3